ncbi:hypothetical protein Zmor_001521 [Zophobas morio]|uniref:Kazal-like domain-containing protein n=1 Tax=Zophobas morio TaxID=2755281 RepID=A0AA38MRZ3_9CUCU|nr:hypothetical protein Zmor_001521 [Zophobas morio]
MSTLDTEQVHIFKCFLVTFAFVQSVVAYHASHNYYLPSDENRYELPQNNYNKYIHFDNFDDASRSGRQINSGGFDWDSPSGSFNQNNVNRRRFNGWGSVSDDSSDSFIFEDDFDNRNFVRTTQRMPTTRRRRPTTPRVPISTVAIPGMGTPRTPCEDRCLSTPEYNPVCGDDDMTYFSRHRLICAQKCGKRVKLKHLGACSLLPPRG